MDLNNAQNLIEGSKFFKILKKENFSVNTLANALFNFSYIKSLVPNLADVEINPLIITMDDVWAVDTKVFLNINASNNSDNSDDKKKIIYDTYKNQRSNINFLFNLIYSSYSLAGFPPSIFM